VTADEVRELGTDIALAIKARGQMLADQARAQEMGEVVVGFITKSFDQAADVAMLRAINRSITIMTQPDKQGTLL
jgi:hypothetical protein